MTKKINMLYDANILASGSIKGVHRTGVFFAAYNVLKKIAENHNFAVTLYIYDNVNDVKKFRYDSLLSQFPVCINIKETINININTHRKNIKIASNMLKKAYYSLKLLKNYLRLFIHHRDNGFILKSVDVYFSPMHAAPAEIKRYPHIKHFMLLHDVIALILPQYFPDITSDNYWFNKMTGSLNKNTYYFCNSKCTKRDFLKYFGTQLDENKLIVTYIAASQKFHPDYEKQKLDGILKKYNIQHDYKNKYIFSFCTLEPRKNLVFTIQCFMKFIKKHTISDLYFYIGGTDWDFFINEFKEKTADFSEYRDKIIRLGYVDDEDVNILYSNSLFFTYISQYEGFGMPPLEAMQAGTPVITSNNSSLPEVLNLTHRFSSVMV